MGEVWGAKRRKHDVSAWSLTKEDKVLDLFEKEIIESRVNICRNDDIVLA